MNEQVLYCEAIVADLVRLFPDYPPTWFTSNAARNKLGEVVAITMPPDVARELVNAFMKKSST